MNYKTMSRNFICKMAMPLALMFAACSTDEGNAISKVETTPGTQMGGSSEEPNVIAYENISLMARAYYAPAGNEAGSSEEIAVSIPQNTFLDGGTMVLTEIDSVTQESLGDSSFTVAFNDSGVVRFDSVSLKSPIVSLSAVSDSISLKAIVDIRDSGTFIVDGLSDLVAVRIKKLLETGVSFTTAKTQAETEMANLFGLGAGSSTATAWRKAFNEVISYNLLQRIKMAIDENGTIVPDDIKISLVRRVESSYIFTILQVSPRAFESLGNSAAAYYQECLQKRAYFASLLASVFGLGGCSSENEGAFADFSSDMYELKCESNAWSMVFRKTDKVHVDHTFGTMTDTRDGKTYKTVQLNLGDVTQTWMAENLNYETEGSSCFLEDLDAVGSLYCLAYGRMYSFVSVLDSSYRKYNSKEECVAVITAEYLTSASSKDTLYWTERAQEDCDEIFEEDYYKEDPYSVDWERVADSLDVLDFEVCPDGWRMPRYEDWMTLFQYLRNHFDVEPGEEVNLLLSSNGNPTGFSMDLAAQIKEYSGWYRILVKNRPYLFLPTVLSESARDSAYDYSTYGVYGEIVFVQKFQMYNVNKYVKLEHAYSLPEYGFVRCIKDE